MLNCVLVHELEIEVSALENHVKLMTIFAQRMQSLNRHLQHRLNETITDRQNLIDQLSQSKASFDSTEMQRSQLDVQCRQLVESIEDRDQMILTLKRQLTQYQNRPVLSMSSGNGVDRRPMPPASNSLLNQSNTVEGRRRAQRLEERCDELDRQRANLQRCVDDLASHRSQLQAQVSELRDSLQSLASQISTAHSQHQSSHHHHQLQHHPQQPQFNQPNTMYQSSMFTARPSTVPSRASRPRIAFERRSAAPSHQFVSWSDRPQEPTIGQSTRIAANLYSQSARNSSPTRYDDEEKVSLFDSHELRPQSRARALKQLTQRSETLYNLNRRFAVYNQSPPRR